MLNYVWIALLFLGIVTALIYDIGNQSSNHYKNGVPLKASIHFSEDPGADKRTIDAEFRISAAAIKDCYNVQFDKDLIIPALIYFNPKGTSTFKFTLPEGSPEIWNEIAKVNGKENDISGKIIFYQNNDSLRSAGLLFEEVSFVKLKGITNELLNYAAAAVQIALGLIGVMALWLGIMKIAESAGLIASIAKLLKPITKKLFPEVPSDHPAIGSMVMNISANMLGLGNAATPFGLKAMEELDKLNPDKGTATNSMITFLAINTAGLTLIPASAIAVRAASGSSDPALIIGTTIFGSACATTAGVAAAKLFELFQKKDQAAGSRLKKILFTLLFIIAGGLLISIAVKYLGGGISTEFLRKVIETISILAIPLLIISFVVYGAVKKVKVYEQFIEGAKEGFNIAVRIIPYLVAILVAIGIFRAGGAMDWLVYILSPLTNLIGMPAEALPMALMRPLSGSGSLGIMAEIFTVHGPDSFLGILVSTFYGSTETTFYVLAVYFGAVNIKNTRHALPVGLIADAAGLLAALFIVKLLFG